MPQACAGSQVALLLPVAMPLTPSSPTRVAEMFAPLSAACCNSPMHLPLHVSSPVWNLSNKLLSRGSISLNDLKITSVTNQKKNEVELLEAHSP